MSQTPIRVGELMRSFVQLAGLELGSALSSAVVLVLVPAENLDPAEALASR